MFPYKLDKKVPRGISIENWLNKDRLGLVPNDFQNFCTVSCYGEIWNKIDNGYFFKRYEEMVLPNRLKLLAKAHGLGELSMVFIYNTFPSAGMLILALWPQLPVRNL